MTTTEAHALIRKASNGAELDTILNLIAAAAAAGTLADPEEADYEEADYEADEEADYEEADYEADLEALMAELD